MLGPFQRVAESLGELGVHCVARLGPVQRHDQDVVAQLGEYGGGMVSRS